MTNEIIESIFSGDLDKAKKLIYEQLDSLLAKKLSFRRRIIGKQFFKESNVVQFGRTKLIRRRIRKGKVQRNIRKSSVRGFTLKGGKLKRITAIQRIHMSRKQKLAARKRRSHMATTVRKRARSILRRKTMGIK
jgi:hypothetical protein